MHYNYGMCKTHYNLFRLVIVRFHGIMLLIIFLIHRFMITGVTIHSDWCLRWSTTRGPIISNKES